VTISVRWTNASIWGVAGGRWFVGPEQELGALGLPKIDRVMKSSHIGWLDDLKATLLDGAHLNTTPDALDAGLDRVA